MAIEGVQIRRADSADVEAIAAAHRDAILSIGAGFYPPHVVADWQAGISRDLYLEAMARGEVFFVAIARGRSHRRCSASSGWWRTAAQSSGQRLDRHGERDQANAVAV